VITCYYSVVDWPVWDDWVAKLTSVAFAF
jgi:hypothetical protein